MNGRTWIMAASLAIATTAAVPRLGLSQARSGYLPSGTIDITTILQAAPHKGDAQYEADRAIFRATRHWLGTPRGDLATHDVRSDPATMLGAFSCALGVSLTPQAAPKTMTLIGKAAIDTSTQAGTAKNYFKRDRPFVIDKGPVCEPLANMTGSYDYPSGHATWSWTWALLLAELAPDRSTAILTRGRAYGESRIVCGSHNASAVEAGRITASATLAADHGQAAFQADVAAARAELAALRADPATPKPQNCAAEEALISKPIL
ncbi:phosphatase PAP2 family protein [Sphingomonas oligophenolica]|uniref:Acid phosphatase n=1 Tax=Sphingomonas oligophenolica TaxID=301154 RepID=A0ABU9Y576_9SPHN